MAETNAFERTFERTLCDGTAVSVSVWYQVSGIHQNTSCFVFCTTTRPKLLINDCGKRNKETAIVHSYFQLFAAGMPLCSNFKTLQC